MVDLALLILEYLDSARADKRLWIWLGFHNSDMLTLTPDVLALTTLTCLLLKL